MFFWGIVLTTLSSCQSNPQTGQNTSSAPAGRATHEQTVGGPCEGCEAIYEYGDRILTSIDTLPEYLESEPKIHLSGTVFQADGRTPASEVIIYIYHTNRQGIYPQKDNETGWAQRHGYLRGWTRTDSDGQYQFHTFRPAAYPQRSTPEHIHITIKEPDFNEYYIDDIQFADDPLLTDAERAKCKNRSGSGIVEIQNGEIRRDIVLGLNIPGYE
jgi:protocatechuate 3,4-dioxygenase beta subunit